MSARISGEALWVDVEVTEEIPAGDYEIEIQLLKRRRDCLLCEDEASCRWVTLSKQEIMHTEWMHADCLADYYHVEVFSEEHWQIRGKFLC